MPRWQHFAMGSQKELKTTWFLPPRRQQTWVPDLPDMKTKYAESERKGNHHHSFMFNINGNTQNLSSPLQTNEWLIPFAAATLTTTASERNNVGKKNPSQLGEFSAPSTHQQLALDKWSRKTFAKYLIIIPNSLSAVTTLSQAKPLPEVCRFQCS